MKWRVFKEKADNQDQEDIEKQQQEAFRDLVIFHVLLIVEENKNALKYKGNYFKFQVEGTIPKRVCFMWCDIKNYYYK